MQEVSKVFSSDITRGPKSLRNNLYDLLNVVPAQPTVVKKTKESTCDFQPKIDKYYTPKKRNKLKVKTIRDIRNVYEKDVYSYLPSDLEKQQNILLRKITGGSSRDEQTQLLSTNLMKSQNPISRSAWQMLMNLNPEGHVHCIQFVLWNGKRIRVNGSKGGKSNFLFNYDLANKKVPLRNKSVSQNKGLSKKKGLLRNSLTIKFKPGPLTKKKLLDDSYQKYSVGDTELINLPKPELDIQPTYGVVLEPTITNFLQNLREVDGKITGKWAEFAVSVLGTLNNTSAMQNKMQRNVTFELNYKSNQRRILMRRDVSDSTVENEELYNATNLKPNDNNISSIISEVTTVINNILDSVEINLQQDTMYTGEDDPREFVHDDSTKDKANNLQAKDKIKRNLELDRLDVTIIRLPDLPQGENIDTCQKAQCSLGCICSSLQCNHKFMQHCGRIECMFKCKCDFLKYKVTESLEKECSELIPGLFNLNNKINLRLAKEEQKFHQTVIMTGEKSVLLKSEKRNWKATKRYADFYCDMNVKSDIKTKRVLSVVDVKLNCENIEPWCMVHNLYQCFCQGKFTCSIPDKLCEPTDVNETIVHHEDTSIKVPSIHEEDVIIKNTLRNRIRPERSRTISRSFSMSEDSMSEFEKSSIPAMNIDTCARIKPYMGRKYYDSYYLCTNKKILEMEKNDLKLHEKMMSIINNMEKKEKCNSVIESNHNANTSPLNENEKNNMSQQPSTFDTILPPSLDDTIVEDGLTQSAISSNVCNISSSPFDRSNSNTFSKQVPKSSKPNLISWLELNYKHYKDRLERGIVKASLDPPKHGKMGLYPWEFILSRYKERKNLFLITKQSPYRVFMAVDAKNAFFDNCINIDDIRFADLHKYPATAKNLLTNATDLKDNFCILRGLTHCWEWIGSANVKDSSDSLTNLKKTLNSDPSINQEQSDTISTHEDKINSDNSSCDAEFMELDVDENNESTTEVEDNSDTSKWFVMTVENDFSEIQFNKRGFYVKYESIIKAINVANISEKTVCLSSQKCTDQNCGPQFGIYAIPNASEYCVFVGPYDKEDALGIEIVKSISNVRKLQRTRGVWITTKKVDNLKVIDNPLSFMPRNKSESNKIVALEPDFTSNTTRENSNEDTDPMDKSNQKEIENSAHTSKLSTTKLVKPIKIRRTNGFYHLQPKGFLKQVTLKPSLLKEKKNQMPGKELPKFYLKNDKHQDIQLKNLSEPPPLLVINPSSSSTIVTRNSVLKTSIPLKKASTNDNIFPQHYLLNVGNKKPVAEIAPQIKIVDVYSESSAVPIYNVESKKNEGSMFVLKPEEINKRLMQNKGFNDTLVTKSENDCVNFCTDTEMNQDIEDFLATSKICTLPNSDIYVVSDDEDACNDSRNIICNYEEVWIECRNIDLGWIRGRRNPIKELSFEFPGFKYTDFYIEEEAFSKINQVLSRKIYVPKNLNLEWQVIESEEELKTKHMLNPEELGADFVLTKRGLRHKKDLVTQNKRPKTTNKEKQELGNEDKQELGETIKPVATHQHIHTLSNDKVSDLLNDLEEQSRTLENEGDMLLSEFKKKGVNLRSFRNVSDNQRYKVTETLQHIMSPISPKNEMDINMSPVSDEHDS